MLAIFCYVHSCVVHGGLPSVFHCTTYCNTAYDSTCEQLLSLHVRRRLFALCERPA
jgi:hypothetical protein